MMDHSTTAANGAARERAQAPCQPLAQLLEQWRKARTTPALLLVPREVVNTVDSLIALLLELEARIQTIEGATNGVKAPHPGKNKVP